MVISQKLGRIQSQNSNFLKVHSIHADNSRLRCQRLARLRRLRMGWILLTRYLKIPWGVVPVVCMGWFLRICLFQPYHIILGELGFMNLSRSILFLINLFSFRKWQYFIYFIRICVWSKSIILAFPSCYYCCYSVLLKPCGPNRFSLSLKFRFLLKMLHTFWRKDWTSVPLFWFSRSNVINSVAAIMSMSSVFLLVVPSLGLNLKWMFGHLLIVTVNNSLFRMFYCY